MSVTMAVRKGYTIVEATWQYGKDTARYVNYYRSMQ